MCPCQAYMCEVEGVIKNGRWLVQVIHMQGREGEECHSYFHQCQHIYIHVSIGINMVIFLSPSCQRTYIPISIYVCARFNKDTIRSLSVIVSTFTANRSPNTLLIGRRYRVCVRCTLMWIVYCSNLGVICSLGILKTQYVLIQQEIKLFVN